MDLITGAILLCFGGSFHILSTAVTDGMIEVAEKGYKFDYKRFIKDKIKEKDINNIMMLLPLGVPIVNLFYSAILGITCKDSIKNELENYLVPFNYWEKEKYKQLKDEKEKIKFLLMSKTLEKEEEPKKESTKKQKAVIPPLKRVFLNNDRLEGLYTLDEVKKLNETTGYFYRVGKLDNQNIAIIGNYGQDPNEDDKAKIVEFLFEEEISEHKFFPDNELNVTNKKFIVYTMTINEKFEECLKNIKLEKLKLEKEELITLKEEYQNKEINKVKKLKK